MEIKYNDAANATKIKSIAKEIEEWYYATDNRHIWPLNEMVYMCCGILKEIAQGLEGGNFDDIYIHEKNAVIASLIDKVEVKVE